MRSLAMAMVLTGATAAALQVAAPPDARVIVAAARAALGGEQRIASVKTLLVTGRTRQLRGDNLIPIEFEFALEAPDRYVRREEVPAQGGGPTRRGFNGHQLIQPTGAGPQRGAAGRGGPPPLPPPGASPPSGTAVGRAGSAPDPVEVLRQDLVRILLGMCAASLDVVPIDFRYAGTAEAPEGTADALDVTGPAGFAARLFVGQRDRLPLMISWAAPPTPQGPVEHRLYFADFRAVGGLTLPFRIRRANGVLTIEETTIDRYRVNPTLDPRQFEVSP